MPFEPNRNPAPVARLTTAQQGLPAEPLLVSFWLSIASNLMDHSTVAAETTSVLVTVLSKPTSMAICSWTPPNWVAFTLCTIRSISTLDLMRAENLTLPPSQEMLGPSIDTLITLGFGGGGLLVCLAGEGTDEGGGDGDRLGTGDGAALVDGVTITTGTLADVLMPGSGRGINQTPATTRPAHTTGTMTRTIPECRIGTC